MTRARRALLGLAAVAFALAGLLREPRAAGGWLAPIASLASSVQWIRFESALADGREALAYRRAETALALDPAATDGWAFFAGHLVYERGSAEVEHDPARRWEWVRAGLETLSRGERTAHDPGRLVLYRGLVHLWLADTGGSPTSTPAEHRERGRALLAEAEELGHGLGAALEEALQHEHEHH